jgi:hypothetical protein
MGKKTERGKRKTKKEHRKSVRKSQGWGVEKKKQEKEKIDR